MHAHILDSFPILALFAGSLLLMLLMLELGFRLGNARGSNKVKAQTSQVRALMGATLGLLAFLMAFTFAAAQNHFEKRIQLQIDEAMLARQAFMRAELTAEPIRGQLQELLVEYGEIRVLLKRQVEQGELQDIPDTLRRSEEIQLELWAQSKEAAASSITYSDGGIGDLILELMAMQSQRIHAAMVNRIPFVIWIMLYFTAIMAMIVVGYQAGLTGRRSPVATFSLSLAFAAVLMLILDLDRPVQSLFEVDVSIWEQTVDFMRR